MNPPITRQNHYVPIWYQKGFIVSPSTTLFHLDLDPTRTILPDGRVIARDTVTRRAPKSCFWSEDLYTTTFGATLNDEVERYLFGVIDNHGANAVRAFAKNNLAEIHKFFQSFFEYLDAQKLRTPKGLDWIRSKYPNLTQLALMLEMQGLRQMHCTMWYESVREIVSAEQSNVKFIATDHPVTVYNAACPPTSSICQYPDDPSIEFKGTQTVFALDADHCLILSHLEYAKTPQGVELKDPRTHARYYGQSIARTDAFIRTRKLSTEEVISINFLLKARAHRYIAASEKEWLYPEKLHLGTWESIGRTLLPPSDELWHFGGEIFVGYKDGSTHYQDEFGRTSGAHKYLQKKRRASALGRNVLCGCGSSRPFKKCCEGVPEENRPSWSVYSIRERNLMFSRAVQEILGINGGKNWEDVRRELNDDQVKRIHEAFESLWPKDTDLGDLLPRPNQQVFRALYLGVVDPRTIAINVTSWLAYFDEIIIPNPFVNAACIKPEYSPTHSPSQYKGQTLKNVLLLLMLEPFIHAGLVHMVPDPADFNDHLRRAVWGMAEERAAGMQLGEEDMARFRELSKDDLRRTTGGLPVESLRNMIQRSSPNLKPEEIELVINHIKEEHANDPLALLQPMMPGENSGHLQIIKGFNLELALYLAQSTGAAIYTDVLLHWRQLHAHTSAAQEPKGPSVWPPLVERLHTVRFMLDARPEVALQLRMTGKLEDVRSAFRHVGNAVRNRSKQTVVKKKLVKQLATQFREAAKNIQKTWRTVDSPSATEFQGNVELSVPENGFERNTVRRLLLTYGRAKEVHAMPMALFVKIDRPTARDQKVGPTI